MSLKRSSKKLIISATTVGNILEWSEFGLYAYLGPTISKLFFPPSDSVLTTVINILLIFAVGLISRPVGGLFFGYIGDRYGRRISILASIMTITFPTIIIGMLPTYAQIGYWAPFFLCLMRILQGFSVGGEFPGTICYLMESADPKERGFMGSFAFFGGQLGVLLNIGECLLMEHYLTLQQILDWGWRVSFLIGGMIGLLGITLRHKLKETPLFEALEKQEHVTIAPIHRVMRDFKGKMLFTFLIASLPLGGIYLLFVFTPVYLEQFFHMDMTKGLLINGAFLLLSTILLPFFGKIGDRYGIKPLLMCAAALCALIAFPFYYMVSNKNLIGILTCEFFLVIVISFHFALLSQSISGLFPTSVRFTGLAFSYNICNILIAGMVPFLGLYLVQRTGNVYIPAIFLIVISLVTFFALIPLRQRAGELDVKS